MSIPQLPCTSQIAAELKPYVPEVIEDVILDYLLDDQQVALNIMQEKCVQQLGKLKRNIEKQPNFYGIVFSYGHLRNKLFFIPSTFWERIKLLSGLENRITSYVIEEFNRINDSCQELQAFEASTKEQLKNHENILDHLKICHIQLADSYHEISTGSLIERIIAFCLGRILSYCYQPAAKLPEIDERLRWRAPLYRIFEGEGMKFYSLCQP